MVEYVRLHRSLYKLYHMLSGPLNQMYQLFCAQKFAVIKNERKMKPFPKEKAERTNVTSFEFNHRQVSSAGGAPSTFSIRLRILSKNDRCCGMLFPLWNENSFVYFEYIRPKANKSRHRAIVQIKTDRNLFAFVRSLAEDAPDAMESSRTPARLLSDDEEGGNLYVLNFFRLLFSQTPLPLTSDRFLSAGIQHVAE